MGMDCPILFKVAVHQPVPFIKPGSTPEADGGRCKTGPGMRRLARPFSYGIQNRIMKIQENVNPKIMGLDSSTSMVMDWWIWFKATKKGAALPNEPGLIPAQAGILMQP